MKSIQLLVYKPEEGAIELRARDYRSNWMMAVEVLDDDTYVGAEMSCNLFTLRKNSDAAADEERNVLDVRCRTGFSHM
jgi:DNA damage-binding protein 1